MSESVAEASQKTNISLLSLFPAPLREILDSSILRRAQAKGLVDIETSDIRAFSIDKHRNVDDTPVGGDHRMLFTAPVLDKALQAELAKVEGDREKLLVIYPHPRGLELKQSLVESVAQWMKPGRRVAIVCGRYEGIDERVVDKWVDLEVSVGDFILTGGELPALMITDALVRLLPGVLGNELSNRNDSFSQGLLEHGQYTKPREFQGLGVPESLLSGKHSEAEEWRVRESLMLTAAFRPDLIRKHDGGGLPYWARELLERLQRRLDLRV